LELLVRPGQTERLGLDLIWVNDFDTGISGKPGSIEGENGGESIRLHLRDQARVVRGLARNLVLSHEGLPDRIELPASRVTEGTCS